MRLWVCQEVSHFFCFCLSLNVWGYSTQSSNFNMKMLWISAAATSNNNNTNTQQNNPLLKFHECFEISHNSYQIGAYACRPHLIPILLLSLYFEKEKQWTEFRLDKQTLDLSKCIIYKFRLKRRVYICKHTIKPHCTE